MTDADGGAPASALRPVVTFEPVAAAEAIGSLFASRMEPVVGVGRGRERHRRQGGAVERDLVGLGRR